MKAPNPPILLERKGEPQKTAENMHLIKQKLKRKQKANANTTRPDLQEEATMEM